MKLRKFSIMLVLGILSAGAATAQSLQVEGLSEEDVQTSFTDNGVRFQTDYTDQTISYKDVMIPERLQDDLSQFQAQYQGQGNQAKLKIQYSFQSKSGDADGDMPAYLSGYQFQAQQQTNPGQKQFQVQSSLDAENMGNGSSLEEDADYQVQVQQQNEKVQIDGSLNRKLDGQQLLNDASLNFSNTGGEFSFDTGVIKPQATSNFEHLVVRHTVRPSVSPGIANATLSTERVFSGPEPDRVPLIDSQVQAYTASDGEKQRIRQRIDNQYDEARDFTVLVAVHDNHSVQGFSSEADFSPYSGDALDVYREAEQRIDEQGLSQNLKISNPANYEFQVYNLSVPPDSTPRFTSTISTDSSLVVGGHKVYVLGSIGGTTTFSASGGGGSGLVADYNKVKDISVPSISGSPVVSKAQPLILKCGSGSNTGTGNITVGCSNINGKDDIAVVDESGNLLDYEIQSFSLDSGGSATLWVYNSWARDGTVQAKVLYGDNSANTDRQDAAATWGKNSQNTLLAQHLNEQPDSDSTTEEFKDSTSNNNDGDSSGYTQANGVFTNSVSNDGTDDRLIFDDDASLEADSRTWSFFLKSTESNANTKDSKTIWSKNDQNINGFTIENDGEGSNRIGLVMIDFSGGQANVDASSSTLYNGNFHHLMVTYDANNDVKLFVDGSQIKSGSAVGPIPDHDETMNIGADSQLNSQFSVEALDATVDEAKMFSDIKDVAWARAETDASPVGGQVFFSQEAAESTATAAPVIDNIDSTPTNWSVGQSTDLAVNATSPAGLSLSAEYQFAFDNGTVIEPFTSMNTGTASDFVFQDAYTPQTPANYTLTINVTDSQGGFNESTTTQEVLGNQAPTASLSLNASTILTGETVLLDASGSTDPDGSISSFDYDVDGDGTFENTAAGSTLKKKFSSTGSFSPTVRVTDNNASTDTANSSLEVQAPPNADITANSTDIDTNETVLLDASASSDSDGTISSTEFDLNNDGTFETSGTTAQKKFSNSGTFTVPVRVTDNDGLTDTASIVVDVGSPPTASITANATSINTSQTVEFDASGSTDPGGGITSTEFDLDNDGTFETSGTTALKQFTNTGDFPVSVKVTDTDGLTDTDSLTVSVTSTTSNNTTTTTATTVNASGGQLVIAFAIVAFSFAFLAVKTPDKQGGLQILNYLMFFLTVFFLGYLAIATVDNGTSILDVLTPWVNSFYAPLALVFAYFAIMMLSKVLEEFDSLDL